MRTNVSTILSLALVLLSSSPSLGYGYGPLTVWEEIHQTLNTYPIAIDSKSGALFSQVFTPDAFANYTGPLSNLRGLRNITVALQASVANVLSQHQLGTTVINIQDDKANSTTYFVASLFGTGKKYPTTAYVYLYGQYRDTLVRLEQGWRIKTRYLVFMGPFVGNQSLLGG